MENTGRRDSPRTDSITGCQRSAERSPRRCGNKLYSSPLADPFTAKKVRKDIRVPPAAFPSGRLINELESTHATQWEDKGL
ncbi:hypothetical protein EYF80_056152 [Liparis tanakae]|uniref:Uncharacterized protein n=1 Tax=Liparis tanakae TaxID=230148 RepID=A0A4Z2EY11_9TELE|nr:hypothetical protein EYF80_056152 [Liparis tanakae]